MWTYLANWLVQDGEVPELHAGAVLSDVALRAASWSLEESRGPESVKEDQGSPLGEARQRYDITGTVEAAREPGSVVLRVNNFRLLAEPNSVREIGDDGALERYSPDFAIPAVGTRATAICTLEVMAAYETDDAFRGVPAADLARDWVVQSIRLARWSITAPTGPRGSSSVGPLRQVEHITRMQRWADDPNADSEQVAYILDLHAT